MRMGVYIKGMEMPRNCEKCLYSSWSNFYQIYVCNAIRHDEPVLFDKKQVKSTATVRSGRADNCPLVPVQPHGRMIDADALASDLTRFYEGEVTARKLIAEQPTIDAVPVVRGKWTLWGRRGIYGVMYECSSCHAKYDGITRFCPNCGADMRGEHDGD